MIKEQVRQILQHYGILHQKSKAIEELAELIVALQKDVLKGKEEHSRGSFGRDSGCAYYDCTVTRR